MATNSFYNPTKKRRSLEVLGENVSIKRPDRNRLPLIKMAQTTRTFWTQNEALEYMAYRQKQEKLYNLGEILYLFTFESQPDGIRRYQVADIDVFYDEYYSLHPKKRHTYEIIVEKKPSKLYFDLEYDIAANRHIDGPKLTNNFIQFVLNFMTNRSDDLTYSFEDVLILDSTSSKKFSRHLIFQTKDPFLDNQAVGRFVNLILEDVHGCLINHRCSAISSGSPDPLENTPISTESSVFAKNLLSTLERRLHRFENCQCVDDYSQMRYKDIAEFLVRKTESNGITWFCDTGVYTKNRAFRLLHSSKFDKKECFEIARENQWKPGTTDPEKAKKLTFLASMVYFNGPIRRFIHVDEENPPRTKLTFYRTHSSSYITEDLDKVSMDYPELVDFMKTIAQERTSDNDILQSSRLYKAKEVQNDFRWEISFMYTGDYKFCENIQRHHKNNNIYFVVDMRKGTYRQKCHDFDCRTFAGTEHTLPPSATPWLTIINQEWDNPSPPSMKETL